MPKRTFWLVTGAMVGAGSTLWAERRIRTAVEAASARMQPDALAAEVGRAAQRAVDVTGSRVRDAVTAGREEMLRHEEELWAELAERGVTRDVGPTGPLGPGDRWEVPIPVAPTGRRRPVWLPAAVVEPQREAGVRRRAGGRRAKSPSHLDN
jgi:hypothetical protein